MSEKSIIYTCKVTRLDDYSYETYTRSRILFSTPVQLRKQKYAKEPAQLVLSLKFQSDQHAQMIPYNC